MKLEQMTSAQRIKYRYYLDTIRSFRKSGFSREVVKDVIRQARQAMDGVSGK